MSIAQLFETGEQASQKGHFRNLVLIAKSDGVMANEEKALLDKIARRLSLTPEQVKEICDNSDNFQSFPPANREERYERFIQLIQMVCIDGKIEANERKLAIRLGVSLGFDEVGIEDKFQTIADLLLKGHAREEVLEQIL